jgi:hypothetical protein
MERIIINPIYGAQDCASSILALKANTPAQKRPKEIAKAQIINLAYIFTPKMGGAHPKNEIA